MTKERTMLPKTSALAMVLLAGAQVCRPVFGQAPPTNFWTQMLISDIVAVNGQPVKGTQILRENILRLSPNPSPGQAIADIVGASAVLKWVILKPDGTLIGTLVGEGGLGAPTAIVGGTGAFLGARGESNS